LAAFEAELEAELEAEVRAEPEAAVALLPAELDWQPMAAQTRKNEPMLESLRPNIFGISTEQDETSSGEQATSGDLAPPDAQRPKRTARRLPC
jgi:hypothetical protein